MQTQARNHYNVTQTTKDLHRNLNLGATAINVIAVAPKFTIHKFTNSKINARLNNQEANHNAPPAHPRSH